MSEAKRLPASTLECCTGVPSVAPSLPKVPDFCVRWRLGRLTSCSSANQLPHAGLEWSAAAAGLHHKEGSLSSGARRAVVVVPSPGAHTRYPTRGVLGTCAFSIGLGSIVGQSRLEASLT